MQTSNATVEQLIARACAPRIGDAYTGPGTTSLVVTGLGGGSVSYEWSNGQTDAASGLSHKICGMTTLAEFQRLATTTIRGGHTFKPAPRIGHAFEIYAIKTNGSLAPLTLPRTTCCLEEILAMKGGACG